MFASAERHGNALEETFATPPLTGSDGGWSIASLCAPPPEVMGRSPPRKTQRTSEPRSPPRSLLSQTSGGMSSVGPSRSTSSAADCVHPATSQEWFLRLLSDDSVSTVWPRVSRCNRVMCGGSSDLVRQPVWQAQESLGKLRYGVTQTVHTLYTGCTGTPAQHTLFSGRCFKVVAGGRVEQNA